MAQVLTGAMNAYSKDLRLRVLQAVDRGLPRRRIAELLGVSPSTIKRYVRRRRQGEDLKPKPSTGRKRRILATTEEKHALWKQLEENDEATLESATANCGRAPRVSGCLWPP